MLLFPSVENSWGLPKIRTWSWSSWSYCHRGPSTGEYFQSYDTEIQPFAFRYRHFSSLFLTNISGWCSRNNLHFKKSRNTFLDAYWRQAKYSHTNCSLMQLHFTRLIEILCSPFSCHVEVICFNFLNSNNCQGRCIQISLSSNFISPGWLKFFVVLFLVIWKSFVLIFSIVIIVKVDAFVPKSWDI